LKHCSQSMELKHSFNVAKSKTQAVAEGNNRDIGRYEGMWIGGHPVLGCAIDGSNFAVVKTTEEGSLIIDGFIEYTFGKPCGLEFAEEVIGYFNTKSREIWLCGYRIWDHSGKFLWTDEYKMKLVGNLINCKTKTRINDWSGKIELQRVATKKELHEIFMKFTPLGTEATCVYLVGIVVSMVHYFKFPKWPQVPGIPVYKVSDKLETLAMARRSEALWEIRPHEDEAKPFVHTHPEFVLE